MDTASIVGAVNDAILLFTMLVFTYQAAQMAQQSRANVAATRASVYQNVAQQMLDIDRLFISHPELRAYIYEGLPLPEQEPLRTQVLALVELFVDFFDNFVTQSGQIPVELYEPWCNYARSIMRSSPAACRFWTEHRMWYSPLLQGLLDPAASSSTDLSVQREAAQQWSAVSQLTRD